MRQILAMICLWALVTSAEAQSIKWGEAKKVRGTFTMIGERESDVVLYFQEMKGVFGLGGIKPSILTYDKNCKVKDKVALSGIFDKNSLMFDIILKGDSYQGLTIDNIMNNKEKGVYLVEFDEKEEKSRELVHTIPRGHSLAYFNNVEFMKSDQTFEILYSSDNSKMAVLTLSHKKNIHKGNVAIFDRASNLVSIANVDLNLKNRQNASEVVDKKLKNDGTILLVSKNYKTKKKKQRSNKQPNYSYTAYKVDGENVTTYTLPQQDTYMRDAVVEEDDAGNLYLISHYEEKLRAGANGFNVTKFDPTGNILFTKALPAQSLKKGKKLLDKDLQFLGVTVIDDILLLVSRIVDGSAEDDGTIQFMKSSSKSEYIYLEDYIFDGINLDGEQVWSERLVRSDRSVAKEYLKNSIYYNDEGINLFINTHGAQIAKLSSDKVAVKSVPSKKNHVMQLSVTKDGLVEYKDVSGMVGVTKFDSLFGRESGSFYFLGVTPDYRKLRFGRL